MTTPTADNKTLLTAVRTFAVACDYEREHSKHVTFLAERLFDVLRPLHGLDESARLCLTCAGLLHDIGWIDGQKGHHKRSMEMILDEDSLPLSPVERVTVALTARYHRKALPKPSHKMYSSLSRARQKTVDSLAAILRIADGLDRRHTCAVTDVQAAIQNDRIEFSCHTHCGAEPELRFAKEKADLLEKVFNTVSTFTQLLTKS